MARSKASEERPVAANMVYLQVRHPVTGREPLAFGVAGAFRPLFPPHEQAWTPISRSDVS